MAFLDYIIPAAFRRASVQASDGGRVMNINDPAFHEFVRTGAYGIGDALKNSAVMRSVDLISGAMGMLPLQVKRRTNGVPVIAEDHPLYRVLMLRPNGWQSPFQFKQLMQYWALVHGNAYALITRSAGRVIAANPIEPARVTVDQRPDFSLFYRVSRKDGSYVELEARDVLHLRGVSDDGITGVSRVRLAADVINIGVQSQRAAERIFKNGMMVGGNFTHPGKLSKEAQGNLQASMAARHAGAENAGKWLILEEGMTASPYAQTAVDSQLVELRSAMVEDIGRVFGVPRPLLGVDDTSWGTGIEQLAILFVRFGLAPWFKAWEDAISVSCLTSAELGVIYADFDERELLRGTIKDQFEAFAKGSGAGGHKPWLTANEIRDLQDMPPHPDGNGLESAGQTRGNNEQSPTP
jgi:HK97 family phage portal protein